LEPLVGYDGLFGMFLKRVKTTFVPRRPRSRLSNKDPMTMIIFIIIINEVTVI
jgi:hypothetical protein